MAVGKKHEGNLSPVHIFSHGSTMMLGEDSASARYWERMGEEALNNGVEHVVMMVSLARGTDPPPFPIKRMFPFEMHKIWAQVKILGCITFLLCSNP